ncbi:hypothetical protein VPH35_123669 [Triticum aestivum]
MPRRRGSRRGRRRRRHHLYIVFDDWSCGYSIRKLNLTAAVSGQADDDVPDLPPAFFRLEATHGCAEYFASAFGTRILAMSTRDPAGRRLLAGTFVPMLDVRSMSMTFGPGQEYPINPIYLSVGNKLFSLSESSFEILVWEPTCPPPLGRSRGVEWSWERLPDPPFKVYTVASYAVHPDGRTLLVSTTKMNITDTEEEEATFTFDTEELSWKRLGKWALPFAGRCHFDPQLDAFVGLSKDPDTLGRLCSCYALGSTAGPAPAWKLGKENLFSEDPAERHVGAILVYTGQHRKFCLLVVHDMNRDLTTDKSRLVQYYKVPKATTQRFLAQDPVAFWM